MYSFSEIGVWILLSVGFVWLLILSFWVWREHHFLKKLFPKSDERDIRKKFSEVLEEVANFKGDTKALKAKFENMENQNLEHLQKVALLRFNPYDDTGGDQSFTLALLDESGNGFVLTSLHSRSNTRVFAKPVTGGKSGKYQFSKEEEEVVAKALES